MKKESKNILIMLSVIFLLSLTLVSAATFLVNKTAWYYNLFDFLGIGFDSWGEIAIGIIVFIIIMAGLYDILTLLSLFQNPWVMAILSIGLGLIAGIAGAVRAIAVFMGTITASLGSLAIFLEIGIAIIIFIGLSFGANWATTFSAKRAAAKSEAAGTMNAARLKALNKEAKVAGTG